MKKNMFLSSKWSHFHVSCFYGTNTCVLRHAKIYIYGCVISGELNLELISIILFLIVNIFHNTHSILFFQIKVFWKSPAPKIRTQFSFQMTKTVYLIQNSWLQAIAEIPTLHNFRPPSLFIYANTSRLKLSPSLNWFRILNSTFSRWHIKITHLLLWKKCASW